MMPQPPGSDSAWRAGKGFQISNTRKSIKPRAKYFQLSGASANKYVKYCPETSSMTTNCGSLVRENFATFVAATTPINATAAPVRIAAPPGKIAVTLPTSIVEVNLVGIRQSSQYMSTPTSEPHVPGAFGR